MSSSNVNATQRGRQTGDATDEESEERDETAGEERTPEAEDVVDLSLDVVFEVLKNERRRLVLKYLKNESATVSLGDLAEHVAALENDKPVRALSSAERKRVYVGLYQCHLPKMDDAGIIEFDRNRGTIRLDDAAAQLDDYLVDEDERSRDWSKYYLGLSAGAAVLVLLGTLGALPVAGATTVVTAAFIAAVFGCSLLQYRLDGGGDEE